MKYDFTSIMDRRGKGAIAVDLPGNVPAGGFAPGGPKEGFDLIPMDILIHRMHISTPSSTGMRNVKAWKDLQRKISVMRTECLGDWYLH